jgi:hypothetical protein
LLVIGAGGASRRGRLLCLGDEGENQARAHEEVNGARRKCGFILRLLSGDDMAISSRKDSLAA